MENKIKVRRENMYIIEVKGALTENQRKTTEALSQVLAMKGGAHYSRVVIHETIE